MPTPLIQANYIESNQNQKYLTINEAFLRAEIVASHYVISVLNTPPTTPIDGDTYLIGASPTGLWTGLSDYTATWHVGRWIILNPISMHWVWNAATSTMLVYNGSTWITTTVYNQNLSYFIGTYEPGYKWTNGLNIKRYTNVITTFTTNAWTNVSTITVASNVVKLDFVFTDATRTYSSAITTPVASQLGVRVTSTGAVQYFVGTAYTMTSLSINIEYQ